MLAKIFLKNKSVSELLPTTSMLEYDIAILGRYLSRYSIKVSDGQGLAMPKLYLYFYIFFIPFLVSIVPTKLNHFSPLTVDEPGGGPQALCPSHHYFFVASTPPSIAVAFNSPS